MILIFGGAYQGKRDFARDRFGAETVFEYRGSGGETVFPRRSEKILCGLENFTWECCAESPENRTEAADIMRACRQEWEDKILIINDVSQGIVPLDARTRAFREMNGRLMMYLASEAEQVWRVFCGMGERIK